jgi:hypothetical protein
VPEDAEFRQWTWSVPIPGRGGSVGADQKVFRGQEVGQPGDFEENRPGPAATIFVREVVQNSRDAADELRAQLTAAGNNELPDLEVRFEFRALTGEEKGSLVAALDLANYANTLEKAGRESLSFPERDGLSDLDDLDEPLKVLYVQESGASGMYGHWENGQSKMWMALLNVAETDKPKGAGGSFGYGKAGLVKAAGSKMVFAYSCFKEVEDDGGVTRRALGVSYWPSSEGHVNESGRKYDGWGQLGVPVPQGTYPIVDDEADRRAEQLGIPTRSLAGTGFAGTGTAFVLVDPVISPQDLQRAAERNWWPALEDDETQLSLSVVNYDGEELDVYPASDPLLADFIDAFHAARNTESTTPPQIDREENEWEWTRKLKKLNGEELGRLGLKASNHWSWKSPKSRLTLVALVRKTGMVVEYRRSGGPRISTQMPFLRGVFIADSAANSFLQLTEPSLHNKWKTEVDEGEAGRPEIVTAHQVAERIQNRIDSDVKQFREELKEPDDDSIDPVTLPIVARAFSGSRGRRPPKRKEVLRERRGQKHVREPVAGNDQMMRIRSEYEIGLQDTVEFETGLATVKFAYRIFEDDTVGTDCCELNINPPDGFAAEPTPIRKADLIGVDGFTKVVEMPRWYEYRGRVTKGQPVTFHVLTEPFLKDWILKPELTYKVVPETAENQAADDTDG